MKLTVEITDITRQHLVKLASQWVQNPDQDAIEVEATAQLSVAAESNVKRLLEKDISGKEQKP
jgi:hypothetical protein